MYEITFITKEEKDPVVLRAIEDEGGKIISKEELGRRKFAYIIKKEEAGSYFSYVFEIDPSALAGLDKKLRLNSDILRHLIISKSLKPAKAEKAEKKVEAPKEEIAKPVEAVEEKVEEVKVAPEVKKEAKKPAIKKVAAKKIAKKPIKIEKVEKIEKPKVEITKEPEQIKKPILKKPIEKVEKKEVPDTEERLKALDEKLEELLKE